MKNNSRVTIITGTLPPMKCGIGSYTSILSNTSSLVDKVHVCSGGADANLLTFGESRKLWTIKSLHSRLRDILSLGSSIIHIQYPSKGYGRSLGINILPYILRFWYRKKVVVTLHEYHGSPLLGRMRNLITTLPAHRVIVSNPYDLRALPWVIRRKAQIIPIGSNIKKVSRNLDTYSQIIKKAGFDADKKVGVFFGYAFPNKGLEVLLDAASISNTQILLLTELSQDELYQKGLAGHIAAAQKKGAHIYVAGYLGDQEVSEILQECDYFVLPQPLPITAKSGTAIAAVTHGLPVISTAAGDSALNMPYIHNKNSLLLNPITAQLLANTLQSIESGKISLKPLQQASVGLAEYFSWDNIAAKHLAVYKELSQ